MGALREKSLPKRASSGAALLNLGCGRHYHQEWTNLDLFPAKDVIYHDVRHSLPFADQMFDAVYHSHVLEHLNLDEANRVTQEIRRVLKPGGLIRVAVPDLERICREYLAQLSAISRETTGENVLRYNWIKYELLDQMVREQPGGEMLKAIKRGEYDREFIARRNGEDMLEVIDAIVPPSTQNGAATPIDPTARKAYGSEKAPAARTLVTRIRNRIAKVLRKPSLLLRGKETARNSGELHRWMYDSYSLQALLTRHGFEECRVCQFNESRIPSWDRYALDAAACGQKPRKPDSLYMEATKKSL